MDYLEDSFNDEELTQMAHEISQELQFPKGPYVFDDHYEYMAPIQMNVINSHRRKPLRIVDSTPLSPNDSLNFEIPAIPEKTKSAPVPKRISRKEVIERLELYKHSAPQSMYLPLPYYGGISTDVLRERSRSKKNNPTSSIPDFTETHFNHNKHKTNPPKSRKNRANTIDAKQINIETKAIQRFSHFDEPKTRKKRSNTITLQKKRKSKSKKRTIPRIISPILIDAENQFVAKRNKKKETLEVISPGRSHRSKSAPVVSPTISLHQEEYLVECGDSFMFVSSKNLQIQNSE